MSRGIGALQRDMLRVVQQNAERPPEPGKVACMTIDDIAPRMGRRFTPSRRSMQRALTGLEERGLLVETYGGDEQRRTKFGTWAPLSWTTPAELERALAAAEED